MPGSLKKIEFSLKDAEGLIIEVVNSGGEFELFPRGTSMLPLIVEGRDSVRLVKPENLKVDDIALYKRDNGQFVLHRIVAAEGDVFDMCGDNQLVVEKGIRRDQIMAKVGSMTINGKLVKTDDKRYLAYVNRRRNLKLRKLGFIVKRFPSIVKNKIKKMSGR